MEIVVGIAFAIVVVMLGAVFLGYDDIIKKAIDAKVEIARENRRAAEASLETARIAAHADIRQ